MSTILDIQHEPKQDEKPTVSETRTRYFIELFPGPLNDQSSDLLDLRTLLVSLVNLSTGRNSARSIDVEEVHYHPQRRG